MTRHDATMQADQREAPRAPSSMARVSILIATYGRAPVLHETVQGLAAQTLPPAEIVIVASDEAHVLAETRRLPGVRCILSRVGLCAQRNAAVREASQRSDLLLFLDDDVELHPDYVRDMARLFAAEPDLVLATGRVLADGARTPGIPRAEARAIVGRVSLPHAQADVPAPEPTWTTYGCNMAVRPEVARQVAFDERLPLYGWLEDLDFAAGCSRLGKVVRYDRAQLVHMGTKAGRVSGRRYGFSQIMNPYYIARKANLRYRRMLLQYWLKPFIANCVFSVLPQGHVDRRGRLIGNLKGFAAVLRGRCAPEDVHLV